MYNGKHTFKKTLLKKVYQKNTFKKSVSKKQKCFVSLLDFSKYT